MCAIFMDTCTHLSVYVSVYLFSESSQHSVNLMDKDTESQMENTPPFSRPTFPLTFGLHFLSQEKPSDRAHGASSCTCAHSSPSPTLRCPPAPVPTLPPIPRLDPPCWGTRFQESPCLSCGINTQSLK